MLNELDSLTHNVGRLIAAGERSHRVNLDLQRELERLRAEAAQTRTEIDQLRGERDALRAERDALTAKIDDAQVRLNAIIEKLPRSKNQLDLLPPQEEEGERA